MPSYKDILKEYWGYDSFRGIQEDIIQSIGSGKDTLGLMPTGGGKSITFQVPAMAQEGVCIVITPLIALMKDQVQNLRKRNIKAAAIFSGMSQQEITCALDNCIFGDYKFLYISPERLGNEQFRHKLSHMRVSMITVDESHCISQWGYDFRPAYLRIAEIRQILPNVPVLALTATATPEVVSDIQQRLLFKEENVFKMSFERQNLAYIVRPTEDKQNELLHILIRTTGSAIVYARSRKRTREIAELLNSQGITADFYHAGLDNEKKDQAQLRWQNNQSRVMVATNAFGMGIDKPDVRLVVHIDLPDSIEAYFQEAGRAGRDGLKAYAVVLFAPADKISLHKRIPDTFPDKTFITDVYEHLQYYFQMAMGDGRGCTKEFNLEEFCHTYKYFPVPVDSALKLLTQAGYIEYTGEQDNVSRLIVTITREEFYHLSGMGNETDLLLQVLFRSYTGLFTDYVFINESLLATRTGMSKNQVYQILMSLSKRRIVHYIPRKKTPYIIYTRERINKDNIILAPNIYEDRKERYKQRIESILSYAQSETICRSKMLLHYFGETESSDCTQCDVCLNNRKRNKLPAKDMARICQQITEQLKMKRLSPAGIAEALGMEPEPLSAVIQYMLEEDLLKMEDGMLTNNN